MPQSPPENSSTREVERLREILVGRPLQAIEERLARLEHSLPPMPLDGESEAAHPTDRLAREVRELRAEFEGERLRQINETHRLAREIQAVAASRREIAERARRDVEANLHPWLTRWQSQVEADWQTREDRLVEALRAELDRIRAAAHPARDLAGARDALTRFADAARDLAEHLPPRS